MKQFRTWFFPFLTCLLVIGAAVLPARFSQARDERQLGQIHTEALDAGDLPVRAAQSLPDRMALYASWKSSGRPILSFQDHTYFGDSEGLALAQECQELLTEGEVLPQWIFQEDPFDSMSISRLLLWDPEEGDAVQEPSVFWEAGWFFYSDKSHQKSIHLTLDAETGLPIYLWVNDTNMSQWLPYQEEELRVLAGRFWGLLGLEVEEREPDGPMYDAGLDLSYALTGTAVAYDVFRAPTSCSIQPREQSGTNSNSVSGMMTEF